MQLSKPDFQKSLAFTFFFCFLFFFCMSEKRKREERSESPEEESRLKVYYLQELLFHDLYKCSNLYSFH